MPKLPDLQWFLVEISRLDLKFLQNHADSAFGKNDFEKTQTKCCDKITSSKLRFSYGKWVLSKLPWKQASQHQN